MQKKFKASFLSLDKISKLVIVLEDFFKALFCHISLGNVTSILGFLICDTILFVLSCAASNGLWRRLFNNVPSLEIVLTAMESMWRRRLFALLKLLLSGEEAWITARAWSRDCVKAAKSSPTAARDPLPGPDAASLSEQLITAFISLTAAMRFARGIESICIILKPAISSGDEQAHQSVRELHANNHYHHTETMEELKRRLYIIWWLCMPTEILVQNCS